MRSALRVGLLVSLLGLGCSSGSETGNPSLQGKVSLGLTSFSSAPATAALRQAQGGLVVDQAAVNVSSLRLLPCAAQAVPVVIPSASFDLLSAAPPQQASGALELCGVQVLLTPSGTASGALPTGMTLYLHGSRTDGSKFEVISTAAISLELYASPGSSFGTQPLLLAFDVGAWFNQVDVHGAHAGADGVARLDMTLNPALLATFEAQTTLSAALYVDANGNGALDASELSPVAVHH